MKLIVQNPKIEELKKNLEDKEQVCKESRAKHKELVGKFREIQGNLSGLKIAVQDAETRKGEALDVYVMDESQLSQLEKAREVCELAKETESKNLELLKAIERVLPQALEKMLNSDKLVLKAKREFWNGVSEELVVEVRAKEKGLLLIEQAWAAYRAGGGGSYNGFLLSLFPEPGLERVIKIQREIGALEKQGNEMNNYEFKIKTKEEVKKEWDSNPNLRLTFSSFHEFLEFCLKHKVRTPNENITFMA